MDTLSMVSTGVTGILAFFLKNKHDQLSDLEQRVTKLEVQSAVHDSENKTRDERFDRIEHKLDRLLEKAGA